VRLDSIINATAGRVAYCNVVYNATLKTTTVPQFYELHIQPEDELTC